MRQEGKLNALLSRVWLLHTLYFVIGGIWSIVGRRSFEAVSGEKTDYWLVRTVGGMLTVVGTVIGLAGVNRRITPEISILAITSSAVLTVIDTVYVSKRRISPVYLLDAVANIGLIGCWLSYGNRNQPGTDIK